eukprot:69745-Pyramimonas_sp.AAC.1
MTRPWRRRCASPRRWRRSPTAAGARGTASAATSALAGAHGRRRRLRPRAPGRWRPGTAGPRPRPAMSG